MGRGGKAGEGRRGEGGKEKGEREKEEGRRGLEGAGCWIGACPRDSGALLPPRTKGEGSF